MASTRIETLKSMSVALMGWTQHLIKKTKTHKMVKCPNCNGSEKIGNNTCPKCKGTGQVDLLLD